MRIAFACTHAAACVYVDQVALRIADASGRRFRTVSADWSLSNLTNRADCCELRDRRHRRAYSATTPCARTNDRCADLDGRADDLVRLPDGERARLRAAVAALRRAGRDAAAARAGRTWTASRSACRTRARSRRRASKQLVRALGDALGGRDVRAAVEIHETLQPGASGSSTVISRLAADGRSAVGRAERDR